MMRRLLTKPLININAAILQRCHFSITTIRYRHTDAQVNEPVFSNLSTSQIINRLQSLHDKTLGETNPLHITQETIRDHFLRLVKETKPLNEESKRSINLKVLKDTVQTEAFLPTSDFIYELVKLQTPSELLLDVMKKYQLQNQSNHIPVTQVRHALNNILYQTPTTSDSSQIIPESLTLLDLTLCSTNHQSFIQQQRNKTMLKLLGCTTVSLMGIDFLLRSVFSFSPTLNIYAMGLTYIINMITFGYLSFGGGFTNPMSYIQWEQGTGFNKRAKDAQYATLLDKIAEFDLIINRDNHSLEFLERIKEKGLVLQKGQQEQFMEEYWLSGGDNFEWVEPDQEPALIRWKLKHGVQDEVKSVEEGNGKGWIEGVVSEKNKKMKKKL